MDTYGPEGLSEATRRGVMHDACMRLLVQPGETVTVRGGLTSEQKKRRVVLKRVNKDTSGVR